MDTEDVADLKLVVTEACTCFLPAAQDDLPHGSAKDEGEAPASLRVDFRVSPGSWEVTVSDAENRHAISEESACSPWATGGLGLTIMRALVDRVEHTQSESGGSVIRLSKRTDGQVRDLS
jgi:anti-sigma regulatory factor (Ser/Thr protein kinase)